MYFVRACFDSREQVRLEDSLLSNPNLFPELYLHQMLPPLLTCVVSKSLVRPGATGNHWTLRREAAKTVGENLPKIRRKVRGNFARLRLPSINLQCILLFIPPCFESTNMRLSMFFILSRLVVINLYRIVYFGFQYLPLSLLLTDTAYNHE